MIKYSILTASKADKDGEWPISLVIHEQDPNTIPVPSMGNAMFAASNGWRIKSSKGVQIDPEDKEIFLLRTAGTEVILGIMQGNVGTHYCKSLDEMLELKKTINTAIADFVKAGGFKVDYETETYDL